MEKDHINSSRGQPPSISPDPNNNNNAQVPAISSRGSVVRTVSRGASSEAERELFAIFSGLSVIKMQ